MSFLSTINGFDLVLILTITGLIIWNVLLRQEAESYVVQILQEIRKNDELEATLKQFTPPF